MRQKTNLLAVKSRRILEVFTLQVKKKSSGRIFSIFASKNYGICREVQTHLGSPLPASFTEKVLGAISRVVRPKTKMKRFAVKFRRYKKKFLTHFLDFFRPKVKLFAVGFRRILDVLAFSRFMCPNTKRFAVEFRRILEVFALPD